MGTLVEQPIKTLFQGVSTQPHTIRLPGQVDAADNVEFSVLTGGFSKRGGSIHVADLTDLTAGGNYAVHMYERDESESYAIVVENGGIYVYDLNTGAKKSVATPDGTSYLNASDPKNDFRFVTVADVTFVVNRTVTVAMGSAGSGSLTGKVQTFSDLPGSPSDGDVYKIIGDDGDNFTSYYVKYNGTDSVWEETVNPTLKNSFDASTMPHKLVRESDGSFTFQQATYNDRTVGDDLIVPKPDFVGKKLNDIVVYRARLGLVADETVYLSQSGDLFNFWPDKAVDVLDSDPLGRAAQENSINILEHGEVFGRLLFLTSRNMQFELTGERKITPRNAALEPTTRYSASPRAAPLALSDTLYFGARGTAGDAILFEYLLDEDTLTNTADNITSHVLGYIPAPVIQFAGSAKTNTVAVLSEGDQQSVYVYQVHWQNNQKVQAAWGRWTFSDDSNDQIHAIYVLDSFLWMVISRGSSVFLEKVALSKELTAGTSDWVVTNTTGQEWEVLLDRKEAVTGSYNSSNDETTWTLSYAHGDDIVAVTSDDFTVPGRDLSITYPTSTTVKASGDFSGGKVIFGKNYKKKVRLSHQFVREGGADGRAVTSGKLQLQTLGLDYQNTGHFKVILTPEARSDRLRTFTGRIIGSNKNKVGEVPIEESGTFRVGHINSDADTLDITIENDTHIPSTITSGWWNGYFNEITRQDTS